MRRSTAELLRRHVAPTTAEELKPEHGLGCSQQDSSSLSRPFGDDVDAAMAPIDSVDVEHPSRLEHRGIPPRLPAEGVVCGIPLGKIRLHLHQPGSAPPFGFPLDQNRSKEAPRYLSRRTPENLARQGSLRVRLKHFPYAHPSSTPGLFSLPVTMTSYAVLRIGSVQVANAVVLAPMEDVTDLAFRLLCRQMGADIVYTEFTSSDGIVRGAWKALQKLRLHPEEHPVAIQIFGGELSTVVEAARRAAECGPDFLDLNCGCWVQNVVARNAGAALLKDPDRMVALARAMVRAVRLPVTVKTRLGWSADSIHIVDIARRLEQEAGIAALCVHCRTRDQGHSGKADWSWIPRIKEAVSIPVILNGDVSSPEDVVRAFAETGCDAVMIGRAAIGNPFIFQQAKQMLATGSYSVPTPQERIQTCLGHLQLAITFKGEERAVREFRKFYAGYLRGLPHSAAVRHRLMSACSFSAVEDILHSYADALAFWEEQHRALRTGQQVTEPVTSLRCLS